MYDADPIGGRGDGRQMNASEGRHEINFVAGAIARQVDDDDIDGEGFLCGPGVCCESDFEGECRGVVYHDKYFTLQSWSVSSYSIEARRNGDDTTRATGAIRDALTRLLGLENVRVEDATVVAAALTLTESGIELADAMHLSSRPAGGRFVSFDKAFVAREKKAGGERGSEAVGLWELNARPFEPLRDGVGGSDD